MSWQLFDAQRTAIERNGNLPDDQAPCADQVGAEETGAEKHSLNCAGSKEGGLHAQCDGVPKRLTLNGPRVV